MICLIVFGAIIYSYRALYIKKHGTSDGFFKKAILWSFGIYLAIALSYTTIIPHIIGLIIYLSYYAYQGYMEVR